MEPYSDYIVFMDESGDHSLVKVDADFPIFVLTFVIVEKEAYAHDLVPAVKELKFRFWGHDAAILHSHEIRKPRGDFAFLQIKERRDAFLADLNEMMCEAPYTLVAVAIRKDKLTKQYRKPYSPYHLALELGLERVRDYLFRHGQKGRLTWLLAEARGDKEDQDLELEFRRVMDGEGAMGSDVSATPFEMRILSKKANAEGMQLADLVAHPVARHVLKPDQPNQAFDIIQTKLMVNGRGRYEGVGLKVFP